MTEQEHTAGRPLKFKSVDELRKAIDAYFLDCDSIKDTRVWKHGELMTVDNSNGKMACKECARSPDEQGCILVSGFVRKQRPYTVTGLALALDTSRQTLLNYEAKGEFFDTIKRAKERIENYAEESLYDKNVPTRGVIFSLSNNAPDWEEKRKTTIDMPEDGAKKLAERIFGKAVSSPTDAASSPSHAPTAADAE